VFAQSHAHFILGETNMTAANPLAPPSPEHILQIGLGFWASRTLLSAVELGVFTQVAEKPQDLETLRSALGLHSRAAHDFLDALTALARVYRPQRAKTSLTRYWRGRA
jgi:Dimerisation domain